MAFRKPRSRGAWLFAIVAFAVVLTLTLTPSDRPSPPYLNCILCGDAGLADAAANVLLFLPIGVSLVLLGVPVARAILIGSVLSAGIELAQLTVIYGRDPSIGDVLFDTVGSGLGAIAMNTVARWLDPEPRLERTLAAGASAGVLLIAIATGLLLQPALLPTPWYGQWTPQFGDQEMYAGRVLDARLGALPLPSHRLDRGRAVREGILSGESLVVHVKSSWLTRGLSTIFSIYDDGPHRMLVVAVRGPDLEFYVRRRATAVRLIEPPIRVPGVLAGVRRGDSIVVTSVRTGNTWCVGLEPAPRCGLGYSVGRGWEVVAGLPRLWRYEQVLDPLWLLGLFVVAAWWMPGSIRMVAGPVLVILVCAAVPPLTGLARTPLLEWAGAAIGVVVAGPLRALARRWFADYGAGRTINDDSSARQRSTRA